MATQSRIQIRKNTRHVENTHFILIQTRDDIRGAQAWRLKGHQNELQDYVSRRTYLCHREMSGQLALIRGFDFVESAIVHPADLKVATSLQRIMKDPQKDVWQIDVLLHSRAADI